MLTHLRRDGGHLLPARRALWPVLLLAALLVLLAACGDDDADNDTDPEPDPDRSDPAPAPDGDHEIGTVTLVDLEDPDRNRTMTVQVYYPEASTDEAPVAVVSHGGFATAQSHEKLAYLGRALAANGWVALHPNHSTDGDAELDRPADVSFLLDRVEAGTLEIPGYDGQLDPARVAVAGHTFGAYTTTVLGGATVERDGETVSFADGRVDAIVVLAPQGAGRNGFTDASWTTIDRPYYAFVGEAGMSTRIDDERVEGWRRQPFDAMPPGNAYLSIVARATTDDLDDGEEPSDPAVAAAAQSFVAANTLAFLDTYVLGLDRADEIGTLEVPEGSTTERR